MTPKDAIRRIDSASTAFDSWKHSLVQERSTLLNNWYQLLLENKDSLARIITQESGKPLVEARNEVDYGASYLRWFAEETRRARGTLIPPLTSSSRIMVSKSPVGVCALITPWNFPLAMMTRKVAPALAAGCTVLMKPAHETPLTCLEFERLGKEAGLRDGMVQTITTVSHTVDIGKVLSTHPSIRKISFTGSTSVGKLLAQQSMDTLKRVSMELGGNAPFIVFEDADLDAAVSGLMMAKFRNAGQACVAANRVYVHSAVMNEFTQKLIKRVSQLKVGNGIDPAIHIGPLINKAGVEKFKRHVADALVRGAKLLYGGKHFSGFFVEPTILSNMSDDSLLCQEETFGPCIGLFEFQSESEVVQRANATRSGLAGYFYTRDLGRVFRVSESLEVGMIGINKGIISTEVAPFGGIKESGLGREGYDGIQEYLDTKYVSLDF